MATWSFPTRVLFGEGEAESVGREARGLGLSRVLVITDRGVVGAGLLGPLERALDAAGVAWSRFDAVAGNPTEDDVEAAAQAFRASGASGAVAVGGGSPIDVAKLVVLRSRVSLPFEQLDDAVDGYRHIPPGLPPVIALPTTAGTGSEVGRSGVLTVRSTGRKTVVFSPHLIPRVAILDPRLTVTMPPAITAATGLDALTHCLEARVARGDHPMADAVAVGGLELAAAHLEAATRNGADLVARGGMMKAAMMGAVAFQKGLGACHSLAHPLSSECGVHHGLANALCLAAVVDWNEETAPDAIARVGAALGCPPGKGSTGAWLRGLLGRLGLPSGLGAAGVPRAALPRLSELAFADACHASNPRPCTREDLLGLYERSY